MRNRTNNKALYESIMRKVSRVVKLSLNESKELGFYAALLGEYIYINYKEGTDDVGWKTDDVVWKDDYRVTVWCHWAENPLNLDKNSEVWSIVILYDEDFDAEKIYIEYNDSKDYERTIDINTLTDKQQEALYRFVQSGDFISNC